MAEWLDRWAKRAANVDGADAQTQISSSAAAPKPTASRRDFLKKAGIVGGIAWTVPVMASVTAPAHAASNTPLGGACSDLLTCNNSAVTFCNGSICGGVGALCPSGSNTTCANGRPCSQRTGGTLTCGGPGATCTAGTQCTFGNCANGEGICGGTGSGNGCGNKAACTTDAQCRTGTTCQGGCCKV